MPYRQTGLQGSGTEIDPFLIHSYEEWVMINPDKSADLDPPYYKLMSDINMNTDGYYWKPTDFANGHLNMNDHSIISPKVPVGGYLIRNCDIYSNSLEVIDANGQIVTKGGCGQFLDVRGDGLMYVFNSCSFKRLIVDIFADNMYLLDKSDPQRGLISRASAEQSHFKIHNEGCMDNLITSYHPDDDYPFIDCLFEFNGMVYDGPLINFGYSNPGDDDMMLKRCMIAGKVNCENLTYAYSSCPYTLVNGSISNCAFYLYGDNDVDHKGYGGYAYEVDTGDELTIALSMTDSGCYIANQNGITIVNDVNYRSPSYLQRIGFNVINVSRRS